MDDGRHFTDYRPHCHMASTIQRDNNIHNSFQSRLFLTQNATKLIELNRTEACDKNCCGPCQAPYQISTTLAENSAMVVDTENCGPKQSTQPFVPSNVNAPLQCDSWNNSVVDSGQNCCMPPQEVQNYYPSSMDHVILKRKTVPGGGLPLNGGDSNMYF